MPKSYYRPVHKSGFSGVDSVNLIFSGDELVKMEFNYEPTIEWNSINEFKDQTAKKLLLTNDVWTVGRDSTGMGTATAVCTDFSVNLSLYKNNSVEYSIVFEKLNYLEQALEKERLAKQKEKESFRP